MSQAQLDAVIADVQQCFGSWDGNTTLEKMREDWNALTDYENLPIGARRTLVDAGGVPAYWVDAPGVDATRVVMYFHGGGYVFGSIRSHGALAEQYSRSANARVLFVDYRLAPEHPFPAAVEDAVSAWRWLLGQGYAPARMAIAGDSAGGGISLACLLALKQAGLPLPACATPLSPWVDLEGTGETMVSKAAEDPIVQKDMLLQIASMALGGHNPRDPLASPLHGDLAGLPPLLIQVGTRETLLDDSRRIAERARQAGVRVELEPIEGQIHVFQIFCPRLDEAVQALERLGAFVRRHTGG